MITVLCKNWWCCVHLITNFIFCTYQNPFIEVNYYENKDTSAGVSANELMNKLKPSRRIRNFNDIDHKWKQYNRTCIEFVSLLNPFISIYLVGKMLIQIFYALRIIAEHIISSVEAVYPCVWIMRHSSWYICWFW